MSETGTDRETLLVELSADWLARLDVDHGQRPPTVAVAVISAAEAEAVETSATDAEAVAVVDTPTETETEAEAVAVIDTPTETEAVAVGPPVVVVNRRQLAAAVKRLAATVGGRKFKPILRGVCVTIDAGAVFLATTDTEAEAVEIIETDTVAETRQFIVDFATFRAAVGGNKTAEITIDGRDVDALGVGVVRIPTIAGAVEFPNFGFSEFRKTSSVMIDAPTLAGVLSATVGAADSESFRFALAGVVLETAAGGFVRAVATDGRRLHKAEAVAVVETEAVAVANVPKRAVSAVIDAATAAGGSVCVETFAKRPTKKTEAETETTTNAETAEAETETTTNAETAEAETVAVRFVIFNGRGNHVGEISTRVLDGRYPRWQDIFKTQTVDAFHVDAAALAAVVSSARPILKTARDETRGLTISANGGRLELATDAAAGVRFADTVAASIVADFVPTTLDAFYVADVLAAAGRVSSDPVAVSLADPNSKSGHVVFSASGGRVRFAGVVMPLTRRNPKPKPETETENAEAEAVATEADNVAASV